MIAIVGGGWFGCHIARALKLRSIPFELFEAKDRLFEGASGYNQNRLHLGFHYPRSAKTREQSRRGFHEFLQTYENLSDRIIENVYAVVSAESAMDFETYRLVMHNSYVQFELRNPADFDLENVDGCMTCGERVVCTNAARDYFTNVLRGHVRYGCRFEPEQISKYDFVLNCTYQSWRPCAEFDLWYEPCCTMIYSSPARRAITLMDGPFYSAYPFEKDTHTLYSVRYSRLAKCSSFSEAETILKAVDEERLSMMRRTWESELSRWYPAFRDLYRFEGWHGSVRSCPRDGSDARVCEVAREGNVIHVMSGKIDSIFHAEREVLKCLGCS